jgi:hypothetical protein
MSKIQIKKENKKMFIQLFKKVYLKEMKRQIEKVTQNALAKIDDIVKIALQKHISLEGMFELKRMLKQISTYDQTKKTKKTLEAINMLLLELEYKLEKNEILTVKHYASKLQDMLIHLQKEKIEQKKIDVSHQFGESFVIELKISEASAKIHTLTSTINSQLEKAKSISSNDHQYQILSNEYATNKAYLKVELDQLNRLLSTQKRRESFKMLKAREENIQLANKLVGASFEEAQELLVNIQNQEKDFDQVESNWNQIYQAYQLDDGSLYNDELSKDLEHLLLNQDSNIEKSANNKKEDGVISS